MIRNSPDPLPGVPLIESPFFSDHFDVGRTEPVVFQAACQLNRQGFAVIDFPDPEVDLVADRVVDALRDRYDWNAWRDNGHPMRLQDAWAWNADVRRLAVNATVLELLEGLYGRPAFPFQTLNFPVGTEQHYHSDSVHFSSVPERFMCGVWLALEDIHVDAGPVIYYPGSHAWPIYVNEHIGHTHQPAIGTHQSAFEPLWRRLVDVHKAQPERLLLRKGQALIWAANLLHGGERHRDRDRTRWSQVTHYYFEGCSYYTPMTSDPALGSISFRTPVDIARGVGRANIYNGEEVDSAFIDHVNPARRNQLPANLDARRYILAQMDPARHNLLPPDFDAQEYLLANPDVAAGGSSAEFHYLMHGHAEGRPLRRAPA